VVSVASEILKFSLSGNFPWFGIISSLCSVCVLRSPVPCVYLCCISGRAGGGKEEGRRREGGGWGGENTAAAAWQCQSKLFVVQLTFSRLVIIVMKVKNATLHAIPGPWTCRWLCYWSQCNGTPMVTSPAADHHCPLIGTKLCCLVLTWRW